MGLGTSGTLWGCALQGHSGAGHSKDTLRLGTPGVGHSRDTLKFQDSGVGQFRDERGVDRARRRVEFKV